MRWLVGLLLTREDINVNQGRNDGSTPLILSAWEGHHQVVELLLSREGIQVNQADEDGYAPLIFAADKGHYKVVEMLLRKKGILVNQAGSRLVPLPSTLQPRMGMSNW